MPILTHRSFSSQRLTNLITFSLYFVHRFSSLVHIISYVFTRESLVVTGLSTSLTTMHDAPTDTDHISTYVSYISFHLFSWAQSTAIRTRLVSITKLPVQRSSIKKEADATLKHQPQFPDFILPTANRFIF